MLTPELVLRREVAVFGETLRAFRRFIQTCREFQCFAAHAEIAVDELFKNLPPDPAHAIFAGRAQHGDHLAVGRQDGAAAHAARHDPVHRQVVVVCVAEDGLRDDRHGFEATGGIARRMELIREAVRQGTCNGQVVLHFRCRLKQRQVVRRRDRAGAHNIDVAVPASLNEHHLFRSRVQDVEEVVGDGDDHTRPDSECARLILAFPVDDLPDCAVLRKVIVLRDGVGAGRQGRYRYAPSQNDQDANDYRQPPSEEVGHPNPSLFVNVAEPRALQRRGARARILSRLYRKGARRPDWLSNRGLLDVTPAVLKRPRSQSSLVGNISIWILD